MNVKSIAAAAMAVVLTVTPALAGTRGPVPKAAREGAPDQIEKIEDAIRVLEEMMKESAKSIPVGLIESCGRHGKGVLLVRTSSGGWSDPAFIDIKGGSIGWQAGVQSADVVLVFRTPRSLKNIVEGDFTLGADVGIAAGPLGRTAEASTDSALKAEILSYSRSRGLYAGLTLQGSSIREDRKANRAFYGTGISPKDILAGKATAVPEAAAKLKRALADAAKK
jgi:lipid-binding SYLF domain-containing protein